MLGSATPGMEQQASPKVTEQRGGKIRFVCSLAAGNRGVSRPEGERALQGRVACILAEWSRRNRKEILKSLGRWPYLVWVVRKPLRPLWECVDVGPMTEIWNRWRCRAGRRRAACS